MISIKYANNSDEMRKVCERLKLTARKRISVSGLIDYFQVVRKAAIQSAPFPSWETAKDYRGRVTGTKGGGAKGSLASGGFGNIIEAGVTSKNKWRAPLGKGIAPHGQVSPGVMEWMKRQAPQLEAKLSRKAKSLLVDAQPAQPWVLPAAQRVEAAAMDAMKQRILELLQEATEADKWQ